MKKVLSAILAMVMVLSIGVNAFAVTDVSDWKEMDSYKALERDMNEMAKLYSDYDEADGDIFTYNSMTINYIGDGVCKCVIRLTYKKHQYRLTKLHDLMNEETISYYIIRDDGLKYTEEEFLDYVS